MVTYLLRRLATLLPVLFAAVILTFVANQFVPGDPVLIMLGDQSVDTAQADRLRREYGLDRPIPEQFIGYVSRLVVGDLGLSFRFPGVPVTQVIQDGLAISPFLAAGALALAASSPCAARTTSASATSRPSTPSSGGCGRPRRSW